MRRGFLIFFGVIVMVAAATSAWCACDWGTPLNKQPVRYGNTNITWPEVLYTVNVDNYGKVTGTGSQVKISHSDPGTFCSKVAYAAVCLYREVPPYKALLIRPSKKNLNLCNFNEHDATFDMVFPGSDNALEIQRLYNDWKGQCHSSRHYSGGIIPFGVDTLLVGLKYSNGNYYEVKQHFFKVILNCAKCPPLNVRNGMYVKASVPVTLTESSFVSGGIPPYSIKFDNLPKGMYRYKGSAGWTWTPTLDQTTVSTQITVTDSCQSGINEKTFFFTFNVQDPPPPTPPGPSISPFVQKLTSDADTEVQQSSKVINEITSAQRRYVGVCDSGVINQYKVKLIQHTQVCMRRTYTQAENISAGCVSGDTINSCSRKLFDWCMHILKPERDGIVNQMKDESVKLHNIIMLQSDKIYPR
jgi:hypothetical protein